MITVNYIKCFQCQRQPCWSLELILWNWWISLSRWIQCESFIQSKNRKKRRRFITVVRHSEVVLFTLKLETKTKKNTTIEIQFKIGIRCVGSNDSISIVTILQFIQCNCCRIIYIRFSTNKIKFQLQCQQLWSLHKFECSTFRKYSSKSFETEAASYEYMR